MTRERQIRRRGLMGMMFFGTVISWDYKSSMLSAV